MALRVASTPYLRGKDAQEFERKIEEGLKRPAIDTPTPKLDQAKNLIKQYANGNRGGEKMSESTICIEIQNKPSAENKVAAFFAEKEIEYDADSFESKKWAGRYRFIRNLDSFKNQDISTWTLEITFTKKPMLAAMAFIEPEIKKFFLGV